eukprot:COSAG06_NODE_6813_length_2765_cov_2.024381_4_plen_236_part_00
MIYDATRRGVTGHRKLQGLGAGDRVRDVASTRIVALRGDRVRGKLRAHWPSLGSFCGELLDYSHRYCVYRVQVRLHGHGVLHGGARQDLCRYRRRRQRDAAGTVFDCDAETNYINAAPADITCAGDSCTATECCTVVPARTCADITAAGSATAGTVFDCDAEPSGIDLAPADITCAGDSCTAIECCTIARTCADIAAAGSGMSSPTCVGDLPGMTSGWVPCSDMSRWAGRTATSD